MDSSEPIHLSSSLSHTCCNRSYLFTRAGLLRIAIIIFQFSGLVSISCLIRQKYLGNIVATDTQSAYLFFSSFGFVFAIVLLSVQMCNCIQSGKCANLRWHLITGVSDVIFLVAMIALGITSAIKEYELQSFKMFSLYYNYGSYASASFFAFMCTFCYLISAIFELRANKMSTMHSQFP